MMVRVRQFVFVGFDESQFVLRNVIFQKDGLVTAAWR